MMKELKGRSNLIINFDQTKCDYLPVNQSINQSWFRRVYRFDTDEVSADSLKL